jgi:hypothetical protein
VKRDPARALREALDEVLMFLGDRVPPALVADAVGLLLKSEAEILVAELKAWSGTEQRVRKDVTITELLRQALRKLQVFEELNILPGDEFRRYLDRVTALLLTAIPGDEREQFVEMILDLRGLDPREILQAEAVPGGDGSGSPAGVDPWSTTGVFRALADEVPDRATPGGAPLDAMYRIIAMEPDRDRSGRRWEQMVATAVEHFNRGALARAVTMCELATRMVGEGQIDAETAEKIRDRTALLISEDRLLENARAAARHALLRKLLDFFPAYSPHRLIDRLAAESDRHRRRYLLLLLEVYGQAGRQVILERLETTLLAPARETQTWYLQRNLVYLLNRLSRPADADLGWELRLVEVLSRVRLPVPLVREAVILASSIPHPAAAALLIDRMREVEKLLVDGVEGVHPVPQLWRLANSLAVALARIGTTDARLALLEHALSFHPRLGDTASRLAELEGIDLSGQPEVVGVLIESLRQLAPVRVLGVTVASNEGALLGIVKALVATRTPEVRKALEEVARRYPEREFGKLAAEASRVEFELAPIADERRGGDEKDESVLTGDLGVFGLPQLVQSLDQSRATGQLRLRGENRNVYAVFRFVGGQLAECVAGGLRGEDAFYQAFQYPSAGTFEFLRDDARPSGDEKAVFPLLMEAIRRYDEFGSARSVVGDGAFVRATGRRRPSTPEEEQDGELVRVVWTKIREGATVAECELTARKDSFRVRRLLAHWVAEGAAEVMTGRDAGRAPGEASGQPGV